MWNTRETEEYVRRLKQFAKKHRRETLAMLNNLDTYLQTLQSGVHPKQVRHGFTHDETHGAIAIDQKGAEGKPTQTRLYISQTRTPRRSISSRLATRVLSVMTTPGAAISLSASEKKNRTPNPRN